MRDYEEVTKEYEVTRVKVEEAPGWPEPARAASAGLELGCLIEEGRGVVGDLVRRRKFTGEPWGDKWLLGGDL